jgi:hypothetical protein
MEENETERSTVLVPPPGSSVWAHFCDLNRHVFRTLEFDIEFSVTKAARLLVITRAPEHFSPGISDLGFFGNPCGRDWSAASLEYNRVKDRLFSLGETPAVPDEFSKAQILACEAIGHVLRGNACFEENEAARRALFDKAIGVYEGVIRSCRHPVFIKYMGRIAVPGKAGMILRRFEQSMHPDMRRVIAHSFAGIALCHLLGAECGQRFVSFMSASVSVSADPLILAATLRYFPVWMAHKKKLFLGIARTCTEAILLPVMLLAERRDLLDFELGILNDARTERLASDIAQATGCGRIIDGQLVERTCAACGATGSQLTRCSGCDKVYYCGKACQMSDWGGHKAVCRR